MATTQELAGAKWDFSKKPHVANVADGTYTLELTKVGEPFEEDGKWGLKTKSRFYFKIVGPKMIENPYIGEEINAKINVGSTHPKGGLFGVIKALCNGDPREMGEVTPEELVGRKCKGVISVSYSDDGTNSYSNVTSFNPIAVSVVKPSIAAIKPKPPVKAEAPKPQVTESEEEDMF